MTAPHRHRFLVAPDSFKGTFDAAEVAAAIGAGIAETGGSVDLCPLADGGEGTAAALLAVLGGSRHSAPAHDPLGRPLEAEFVLLADGATAAVDAAAASGLPLLSAGERDAERATSFGTGELIAAAIDAGAGTVLVAAGGSATTDGGRGAIEALREHGGPRGSTLEVLCDVTTPFERAARVFAPQKGADPAAVARLSARLEKLAAELPRDPRGVPMSGCAGGLSGGLWASFDARLRPGAEHVFELLDLGRRLGEAGSVVTGEGRIDAQSLEGKVVGALAHRCARAGKELHAVVGQDGLDPSSPLRSALASIRAAGSLDAMRRAGAEIAAATAAE